FMISEKAESDQSGLNLCDLGYIRRLYDAGHTLLPLRVGERGAKKQRYKWVRDEDGRVIRDADGNYKGLPWENLEAIFSSEESGIGILCGPNGLECLDIEDEEWWGHLELEFPWLAK